MSTAELDSGRITVNGIRTHPVSSTAEGLLLELDRGAGHWGVSPNNWVFRGQADSRWLLLPNALRRDLRPYSPVHRARPDLEARCRAELEVEVLGEFVNRASEQGLPLPDVSLRYLEGLAGGDALTRIETAPYLRKRDEGTVERFYPEVEEALRVWPHRDVWPLLALAQHHGVPTRLLDWSYDPLVAAYFAARGAAEWVQGRADPPAGVEFLSVWGLGRGQLRFRLPASLRGSSVEVVHRSTHVNRNQVAQKGVFSLIRNFPDGTPEQALEVYISSVFQKMEMFMDREPEAVLQVFSMPISQAPKLLRLLQERFISHDTLFPGYGGIWGGMDERLLWDR